MGATTDSEMVVKYDVSNKPGISNLINIYASLTGKNIEEVEEEFRVRIMESLRDALVIK